jgi:hypothetical protein
MQGIVVFKLSNWNTRGCLPLQRWQEMIYSIIPIELNCFYSVYIHIFAIDFLTGRFRIQKIENVIKYQG